MLRAGGAERITRTARRRQTNEDEILAQPKLRSLKRRVGVALRLSTVVHPMRKIPDVAFLQLCNYTHCRWFGFCFKFHLRDEGREIGGGRKKHCDLKAFSVGKQLRPNSSVLRKLFIK